MPLETLIDDGKRIVVAEIDPPRGCDPEAVRNTARRYKGRVHALGVSDNRGQVNMSALAAASLLAAEGVDPILHVVTRDRNRIALVSDFLGAQALGIRNFLCTSGEHQTLGSFGAAKNVFDIDSVQLLQTYASLAADASVVGEPSGIGGIAPLCLGATASPFADPVELQVVRLVKKVTAGVRFVITDPVFDLERFNVWWKEVVGQGVHTQVAILVGIMPLTDGEKARAWAERRPDPMIPESVMARICSKEESTAQRAAGVEIAVETVHRLSETDGVHGFSICGDGDDDAALEVIGKSQLRDV